LEHELEQMERAPNVFQNAHQVCSPMERREERKPARNGSCSNVPAPMERNGGTLDAVAKKLAQTPCPSGLDPQLWRNVIVDAKRLIEEGWAHSALELGWTLLDLFGAVPAKSGNPDADGLAVKIAGRRVLVMSATCATIKDGETTRSIIYRSSNAGAVLLWEVGRGR
jgi:hypothetical protein